MPDLSVPPHRQSIRLRGYDYTQAGAYFVTICTQHRSCLLGDEMTAETTGPGEMIAAWWHTLPGKFPGITLDTFVVMPNHIHGIIWLLSNPGVGADPRVRLAEASDPAEAGANPKVGADPRVRLGGASNLAGVRSADRRGLSPDGEEYPEQGGHVGPPLPDIVLPHPESGSNPGVGVDPRVCLGGESDPAGAESDTGVGADPRVRLAGESDLLGVESADRRGLSPDGVGYPEQGGHVGPPLPAIVLPHSEFVAAQEMGRPVALSQVVQWFKAMTTNAYLRGVKHLGWSPYLSKLWQRDYYERIIRNDRELDAIRAYISANPARWADDPERIPNDR